VGLIIINFVVFFIELSHGSFFAQFLYQWGLIPARVLDFSLPFLDRVVPFFTSMFMHGGWLHLLGNCWFLWIFADNVEDRLGHIRFLLFYLLCGLGAGILHFLFNAGSLLPAVGASGAISGILGAYFVLFPYSRVLTVIPIFFFWRIV